MKKKRLPPPAARVGISDRVKFYHHNRECSGYVCKKGRNCAHIVCDDTSEFRVPYQELQKINGAAKQHVLSKIDTLRLQFHVNDKVSFTFKRQNLSGIIIRTNPKLAHIRGDDGREYRAPYVLLRRTPDAHKSQEAAEIRDGEKLAAIAHCAKRLLVRHHLTDWGFQFDHGTMRAGSCQYDQRVITLSYDFAKQASPADIQDAMLHEVAHALVGKKHNHDAVWKATARTIGCSGERCHDIQFAIPRYIVTCENHCWSATAERKRRGLICKICHGKLVYLMYTHEGWAKEQKRRTSAEKRS